MSMHAASHLFIAALALLWLARTARRPHTSMQAVLAVGLAGAVMLPYGFQYDLCLLAAGAAFASVYSTEIWQKTGLIS